MDGTLIDSNDAHARSWSQALAEFGARIPAEQVRPLIGMGGDKLLPRLLGVTDDSEEGKAFAERRAQIFLEQYVPRLRPTRGAHELVRRLRHEGMRLVVASSARASELETMLRQVGLDDLIDKKTSASDAESSKPDPDIIEAALAKGHLRPEEALLLGDTPYDVQAGSRAGVGTVALLSGGWSADALDGALAIYEDPLDVVRHFTATPFACAA